MAKLQKKKLRLHKNSVFLGLIKKYRISEVGAYRLGPVKYKYALTSQLYKNNYVLVMKIFFIFNIIKAWYYIKTLDQTPVYNLLRYYGTISYNNPITDLIAYKNFGIGKYNSMIVFSRPKKQLFLLFFKNKPIFIFTGGLMRIVMREKRKSSKKLYKVAISLIKLFSILLNKRDFFLHGYLKLINVGNLRTKILNSVLKIKKSYKINYLILKFRIDFTSQKLETRRAIKKYVKKRFKIR